MFPFCVFASEGKATIKNQVDWINTFQRMSITISPTQHNQMQDNGYPLVELRRLVYYVRTWNILRAHVKLLHAHVNLLRVHVIIIMFARQNFSIIFFHHIS